MRTKFANASMDSQSEFPNTIVRIISFCNAEVTRVKIPGKTVESLKCN